MQPYTALAPVYDQILNHVDYDEWYRYLRTLMLRYMERPGLVMELGCGTGKFGAKFSRDDFPIVGMDRSIDMLRVANDRAFKNFHIFCGDMRRFRLSVTVDFIFSVHDTMNYLLTDSDLRKVFSSVRSVMNRDSIFMFDITTEHNIRRFFDGRTTHYRIGDTAVEWGNTYDARKKIVSSIMTFRKDDGTEYTEKHLQKIYAIDDMERLLKKEKFRSIDVFGDYTFRPPDESTVMVNFITRMA